MRRLGERIKQRRTALGISQVKLAAILEVNQSQVSRYELGEVEPPLTVLRGLAIALKCSTDWLLDLTDDLPPEVLG